MTKVNKRVYIAALFGSLAILLLIVFENFTKTYFIQNNRVLNALYDLQIQEAILDYEILENSLFLYKNFDSIVVTQKNIENIFKNIEKNGHLKKDHSSVYKKLIEYKKSLNKKIEIIHDFESINSTIKNSTMYLSTLISKIPDILDENKKSKFDSYKKLVIKTISSIFLAKNSFDKDFVEEIRVNYEKLKKFRFDEKNLKNFHSVLLSHLQVFINNFPIYTKYLNEILHNKSKEKLQKTLEEFIISANKELRFLTILYNILIIFYIASIIAILYLMYIIDKENVLLKRVQRKLEKMARVDPLTGLLNRRVLDSDKKKFQYPVFFIVNIDRFKHFNDFYGINAGDFILRYVAKTLKNIVPKDSRAKFYRIGGDDFGILMEKDSLDIEKIAKDIVDYFKTHTITYNNVDIHLSVSIGITLQKPLIETADMALKYVKKDIRRSFFLYNSNLGFYKKIEENINRAKILKEALETDNVFPYFQPIFNPYSNDIVKFEVLARLKNKSKVESISTYLQIAKETKLYEGLTKTIFEKSFEYFKDKNCQFSLNISMEDISNPNILKFLGNLFGTYPYISQNVTFEILESAAITDYNMVREFVSVVKNMGAKIALDDFGSGFSNYEHILNLNIDYIKIDGSLIKDIDKNFHAELIVKTIKNFAKEANIKTVAEFVHSKEVLKKIKELHIDYAQGFYLSKPKPQIKVETCKKNF
ncbi:EAL domain-containing protein [Nitrosophilus labii]|uniref:EAL domain-containing protein n=1 Tax=Nitrosophilus labii TaxID=2706014 RepID=UPI0016572485|nr:EAL domain-containing protein [Nitrosophilus labii]